MNSNSLFIPERIKIGFQKRGNTLTGNLAYIIYYDEKGVLRKKTSWENWRDKSIEPMDMENIPRSGYIVNEGVTHFAYSSFGSDRFRVRIHSSEGYEFEIYPENMIAIMAVSDISKRYINQECVFAWDGQDLVLLPTNTSQYEKAVESTRVIKGNLEKLKTQQKKVRAQKGVEINPETIMVTNSEYFTFLGVRPIITEAKVRNFSQKNLSWNENGKVVIADISTKRNIGYSLTDFAKGKEVNDILSKEKTGFLYIDYRSNLSVIPEQALMLDFNEKKVVESNSSFASKKVLNNMVAMKEKFRKTDFEKLAQVSLETMTGTKRASGYMSSYERDSAEASFNEAFSTIDSHWRWSYSVKKEERHNWVAFSFVSEEMDLIKVEFKIDHLDLYEAQKSKVTVTVKKIINNEEEVLWTGNIIGDVVSKDVSFYHPDWFSVTNTVLKKKLNMKINAFVVNFLDAQNKKFVIWEKSKIV